MKPDIFFAAKLYAHFKFINCIVSWIYDVKTSQNALKFLYIKWV